MFADCADCYRNHLLRHQHVDQQMRSEALLLTVKAAWQVKQEADSNKPEHDASLFRQGMICHISDAAEI